MEVINLDRLRADNGNKLTRALFVETNQTNPDQILYTLSDRDHPTKGYLSIYKAYLDMEDASEYEFATKFFGTYRHWRLLCETPWFKPYLEEMRSDLQKKLKSRALRKIILESEDPDNKNYFQANKYLADKGYLEKEQKGRPSKSQVSSAAKEKAEEDAELNDILSRLEFKN